MLASLLAGEESLSAHHMAFFLSGITAGELEKTVSSSYVSSSLHVQVAEAILTDVRVDGSLLVLADNVMGSFESSHAHASSLAVLQPNGGQLLYESFDRLGAQAEDSTSPPNDLQNNIVHHSTVDQRRLIYSSRLAPDHLSRPC